MNWRKPCVALILLAVLSAACAPGAVGQPSISPVQETSEPTALPEEALSPTETELSETAPMPDGTREGNPMPNPPRFPGQENISIAALEFLAGDLRIPVEQVSLVSIEAVQWRDASLGCARPGQMYAQVITDGYRLILQANEKLYEVHTDATGRRTVRCGAPASKRSPVAPAGNEEAVVLLVLDALSKRLSLSTTEINLLSITPETWTDTGLGCASPGTPVTPQLVPGYRLVLQAGGRETAPYEVHTDLTGEQIVFCEGFANETG